MSELKQLAANLRAWVREDGRPYEDIARAAGISRASVYNFMTPDKPTSWKVMQALIDERDRDNGSAAA